ncbi:MAG: hypothetical protein WB711_16250 [Terriglobales bacterium]
MCSVTEVTITWFGISTIRVAQQLVDQVRRLVFLPPPPTLTRILWMAPEMRVFLYSPDFGVRLGFRTLLGVE